MADLRVLGRQVRRLRFSTWPMLLLVFAVNWSDAASTTHAVLTPKGFPCGPCVCFQPGPTVDCSSRSLSTVPSSGLPTTATSLSLRNNTISIISDFTFKEFSSLRLLDLSDNLIGNISDAAFDGLENVRRLNLENNRLGTFEGKSPFSHLSALAHLDLSNNSLVGLGENAGLNQSLQWLDLSYNHIITTPASAMIDYLINLTYLDLSHNQMDGLNHLFQSMNSLQILNLGHNRIPLNNKSYPAGVFRACRSSLNELRLEGNIRVSPLDDSLSYPDQALSDLSSLQSLHLDGLPHALFGPGFTNMTSLVNLSFSGLDGTCSMNVLTNDTFLHIPSSLRLLNVSDCNISHIEEDAFRPLRQLDVLDLSSNVDLGFETVGNAFYSLQGSALRVLHINSIIRPYTMCVMVTPRHTRYFKNTSIEDIHAQNNRLESFCEGALLNMPDTLRFVTTDQNEIGFGSYFKDFGSLTNLVTVHNDGHRWAFDPPTEYPRDEPQQCSATSAGMSGYESNCHQPWRPEDPMDGIWTPDRTGGELRGMLPHSPTKLVFTLPPNLTTYVSRWNKLYYKILEVAFNPNNSLTELNLSNNLITVWIGPVRGLNELVTLDLANNFAHIVDLDFFCTLTSLKVLNASRNFLRTVIEDDTAGKLFGPLSNLEDLYLSKNYLNALPVKIFKGLVSLQTLVLSQNTIVNFSVDVTHMKNLTLLDLSFNNIHYLPQFIMDHLDWVAERMENYNKTVRVDMTFNPIACTCEHIDFLTWIQDSRVLFPRVKGYACLWSDGSIKRTDDIFAVIRELQSSCLDNSGILTGAVVCFFCLILVLVSALIYRYRWKLRYLYYASRLAYRRVDTSQSDDFQYDAFVSYSSEDNDFVHGQLLDELEERAGLRLNVHNRDFTPGRLIPCNIVDAVHNSRRTLVVLSRALLQSDWCHYEMQMATMEAAYSGRDVLLFLLYEDVASQELPRDVMYNLQASTYISFPADAEPPLMRDFWARLVQAIKE